MNSLDRWTAIHFGIRSKLIALFVVIKVVPLILLAYLAWQGVEQLGLSLSQETEQLAEEVRSTVTDMGTRFAKASVQALDDRAREDLERLTTDTARAVADFLYDRDHDILLAATLPINAQQYQKFLDTRTRFITQPGTWKLAADGQSWEAEQKPEAHFELALSLNAENLQDFHARPSETVSRTTPDPLYYEITYLDLKGRERIKASRGNVLPKDLRDVSNKANTWSKAETYFKELQRLKPGQIYVSEVIGPYVPSRIIGPVTPLSSQRAGIPFQPEREAFAGQENPHGKHFQGIVRWATPVVHDGAITGYVTLALNHAHIRSFTDNLTPTPKRYTAIPDASSGNYAFMWDNKDRSIAHPRHHSIMGFNPDTGEYDTPWLEDSIYQRWKTSQLPLKEFLKNVPTFDNQSRDKKPAQALTDAGHMGLDCRYLNFAPQCQGWHDLTQHGGSGSGDHGREAVRAQGLDQAQVLLLQHAPYDGERGGVEDSDAGLVAATCRGDKVGLAVVVEVAGRNAEAAQEYRRAVETQPGWWSTHSHLGVFRLTTGDLEGDLAEGPQLGTPAGVRVGRATGDEDGDEQQREGSERGEQPVRRAPAGVRRFRR